jgi:hypothetical protein
MPRNNTSRKDQAINMANCNQIRTEEEKRQREAALDKTLADSFPASDPPSSDPNPCPAEAEQAA